MFCCITLLKFYTLHTHPTSVCRVTKEVAVDSPEARLSEPTMSGPSQGGGASRGRGRGGGLSAVLSQIGKKSKISTLEKSKLDWERFKSEEGLQEEIQTFNRGKDGYVSKIFAVSVTV